MPRKSCACYHWAQYIARHRSLLCRRKNFSIHQALIDTLNELFFRFLAVINVKGRFGFLGTRLEIGSNNLDNIQ
jgi:hypothetical protein